MKRLLLLLLAVLVLAPMASAATVPNFTPYFNYEGGDAGTDYSHYNRTEVLDQAGYIPLELFLFIAVSALVTLCVAYRFADEMCGMLSIIFSFAAMLASRVIDKVTSYGVTSQVALTNAQGTAVQSHEYVSMESHTIYHPEVLTIIFAICFILSILNIYRIYLLSKQEVTNGTVKGS